MTGVDRTQVDVGQVDEFVMCDLIKIIFGALIMFAAVDPAQTQDTNKSFNISGLNYL